MAGALSLGCAAGHSDDGPSWGPPTVVSDGGGDDDEGDEDTGDDDGFGTDASEPLDGDGSDEGVPPTEPTSGDGAAPPPSDDDGGVPPPMDDDGGEPPPEPPGDDDGGLPPPDDLDAQCQLYCGSLQACGILEAGAAATADCMDACTIAESPACDAAWSNVMSCVSSLDCFQMQIWWIGFPGYPCQAQEQAYGSC